MKKTSPIWRLSSEKFIKLVKDSNNYGQILGYFGLKNIGGNNGTLKRRIESEGIDVSHITLWLKTQQRVIGAIPLTEILVKNSKYTYRSALKRRLISANILKNICAKCTLLPVWQDERLVLVLDHINGIRNDNRIENLRLLCPNCNSQTSTFCGRTINRAYNCKKCGKEIKGQGKTGFCLSCSTKVNLPISPRKFEITSQELRKLVWEKPITQIANMYKVSGNAIKKRCKLLEIATPERGYWNKVYAGKIPFKNNITGV